MIFNLLYGAPYQKSNKKSKKKKKEKKLNKEKYIYWLWPRNLTSSTSIHEVWQTKFLAYKLGNFPDPSQFLIALYSPFPLWYLYLELDIMLWGSPGHKYRPCVSVLHYNFSMSPNTGNMKN